MNLEKAENSRPEEQTGNNINQAIQDFLRKGVETDRVTVGETLQNAFEKLKWPSVQEWLENERRQRQANSKN